MTKFWKITSYLLLAYAVVLCYADTFFGAFVFDDLVGIVNNPAIKSSSAALDVWRYAPERWLGLMTFAWNYQWAGLDVRWFHAFNLLLHLVATAGVAIFVKTLTFMMLGSDPAAAKRSDVIALGVAVLFALHPIQTQSVAYIYQRLAVIPTIFYTFGLTAYLKYLLARQRSDRTVTRYFVLTLCCGVAGMFSKESFVTFPVACLLVDLFIDTDTQVFSPARVRRLAPILSLLFILPISFVVNHGSVATRVGDYSGSALTPFVYFLTQCDVIWRYFGIVFFIVPQSLIHDVAWRHSLVEPTVFLGFLGLISMILCAWVLRRRFPLLACSLLFFLLGLAVESSIIPIIDPMFEHRMYLPSVGLFLSMAVILDRFLHFRTPRAAPEFVFSVVTVLAAVGLGYRTIERNKVWQSPVALWSDAAERAPRSVRALMNLTNAYLRDHQPERAKSTALRLLADDPESVDGLFLFMQSLIENGELAEAEAKVTSYAALHRDMDPRFYYLFAKINLMRERLNEAEEFVKKALVAPNRGPANVSTVELSAKKMLVGILIEKKLFLNAATLVQQIVDQTGETSYQGLIVARIAFAHNDSKSAVSVINDVVRTHPALTQVMMRELAILQFIHGSKADAQMLMIKILEQFPTDLEIQGFLAMTSEGLGPVGWQQTWKEPELCARLLSPALNFHETSRFEEARVYKQGIARICETHDLCSACRQKISQVLPL